MQARTEKITFQGAAGAIDCILDIPFQAPVGWALVLHPHSLQGGTRDNKIVTTIARACLEQGLLVVRPNFRGVGASEGEFDHAVGEAADMLQLIQQFTQSWPEAAMGKWVLAGFSFGTGVAARVYSELAQAQKTVPDTVILVGSAVGRFTNDNLTLPDDTLLIHGEDDEVVPLSEVMDFARPRVLPVVVIPEATHFFHGKLLILRRLVQQRLDVL
ncbi:alpha/beta hydrolase [Alcaligenaceae bacterium]|nr:alpha/beta hydrolase [Alcaligenaceae bacterium]